MDSGCNPSAFVFNEGSYILKSMLKFCFYFSLLLSFNGCNFIRNQGYILFQGKYDETIYLYKKEKNNVFIPYQITTIGKQVIATEGEYYATNICSSEEFKIKNNEIKKISLDILDETEYVDTPITCENNLVDLQKKITSHERLQSFSHVNEIYFGPRQKIVEKSKSKNKPINLDYFDLMKGVYFFNLDKKLYRTEDTQRVALPSTEYKIYHDGSDIVQKPASLISSKFRIIGKVRFDFILNSKSIYFANEDYFLFPKSYDLQFYPEQIKFPIDINPGEDQTIKALSLMVAHHEKINVNIMDRSSRSLKFKSNEYYQTLSPKISFETEEAKGIWKHINLQKMETKETLGQLKVVKSVVTIPQKIQSESIILESRDNLISGKMTLNYAKRNFISLPTGMYQIHVMVRTHENERIKNTVTVVIEPGKITEVEIPGYKTSTPEELSPSMELKSVDY